MHCLPPHTVHTLTQHSSHSTNSDEMSSVKQSRASKLTVEDFYRVGRDIQNRSCRTLADKSEDKLFREFFGCSALVALYTWSLLEQYDFITPDGQIQHLLWTLFFMKQYPTEGLACAALGGSKGKIDPKTYRKWVHPFMSALSDLEPCVVS